MQTVIEEVSALKNIRLWFKKVDTAKYISHLDLQRCMARAIHKAKLPFWYTEGFNPHVFLTISMPISLGYTGLRESMDVKLLDDDMPYDEIIEKMNAGLPLDIRIYEITELVMKPGEIAFSEYNISIEPSDKEKFLAKVNSFLAKDEIIVNKKSKKGMLQVDIKPNFADMKISSSDDVVKFNVILPSSTKGGINPRLFFDALAEYCEEELFPQVSRINCYNEKMQEFR